MIDYLVADYTTGRPASVVNDEFNEYGAQGWRLVQLDLSTQTKRRAVFTQMGITEYLVVDYDTGLTPEQLEANLDGFGADGWELGHVDMLQHSKRRAILMRGQDGSGGGGGIEEAPQDGVSYGRLNATWNPVIAHSGDTVDGGSF